MTRFTRSSEVPSVATMIIPVTVTLTARELALAETTADVIGLAAKKVVQGINDLRTRMLGIEFEIENAKTLFADEREGATV